MNLWWLKVHFRFFGELKDNTEEILSKMFVMSFEMADLPERWKISDNNE